MNSLTTSPCQHASKASPKLLSTTRSSKNIHDPNFRTSNPDIFPSLSPFSNFYNKKKQNEVQSACRNYSDDLEPVKRCKLNNGNSKILPASDKMTEDSISPKAMTDKDSFRVPRLPKRFSEKKSQPCGAKVAPIWNFSSSSMTPVGELRSFAGKETKMEGLKKQQNNIQSQPKGSMSSFETVEKVERRAFSPKMDTSFFADLYEKLRHEYLLLQCGQQFNTFAMNTMKGNSIDGLKTDEMNMEEMIARSKDLLREQMKKTQINC